MFIYSPREGNSRRGEKNTITLYFLQVFSKRFGPGPFFFENPGNFPRTLREVLTSSKNTGKSETNKIAAEGKLWKETSTVFAKTTDCCQHAWLQNNRAKQSNQKVLIRDLYILTKSRRFEGASYSSVVLVLIRDLPIGHWRR